MKVKVKTGGLSKSKKKSDLDLMGIYSKDRKEDFSSLEGKPKSESLRRLIYGLVFLLIMSGLGFFVFKPQQTVRSSAIEIISPNVNEITLGQEVTIPVFIQNNLDVALTNVHFELYPPLGWSTLKTNPESEQQGIMLWNFPYMEPKSQKAVQITGYLMQPIGFEGKWNASGTYQPQNFSSDFSYNSSFVINVSDNSLEMVWKQDENGILTINNKAGNFPKGSVLKVYWPSTYLKPEVNPKSIEEENFTWELNSENSQMEINFTPKPGKTLLEKLTSIENEEIPNIKAELWWKGNTGLDSVFTKVYSQDFPLDGSIKFVEPKVSLLINGQNNLTGLDWGETIKINAKIDNPTMEDINTDEIRLFINAENISKVLLLDGDKKIDLKYDIKNGFVSIIDEQLKKISSLKKESNLNLDFEIQTIPYQTLVSDIKKEYKISTYLEYKGNKITIKDVEGKKEEEKVSVELQSTSKNISMNGFWTAKNSLRYYSDEQFPLGSGPLPFQTNQSTVLFWQGTITNINHTLQDLSFVFDLPKNISFLGPVEDSIGTWKYDEVNRRVTWSLNQIPAASTLAGRQIQFKARLSVNPTEASKNSIAILPKITLQATDSTTLNKTEFVLSEMDSTLSTDPFAKYSGEVLSSQ